MAKPDRMPSKDVIDGFKGKIDFYYWKGLPVARSWPIFKPYKFSAAQLANQAAFSYVNKLWTSLDISIKVALSLVVSQTTLTAKDYYVRSYMKGAFALMPPEYYATEATLQLLLAQLDVALSTRALEAGGNLAAILAQLDVALSTRALEAGGNLAQIHARLDAIKLIQGDILPIIRAGVIGSGVGWTTLVTVAAKGILEILDFSTDYNQSDLRLIIDGQELIIVTEDGTAPSHISPLTLENLGGQGALVSQGVYDDVNDHYSIYLTRSIQYNSALKIDIRQNSGVNKNIAVRAAYRPLT